LNIILIAAGMSFLVAGSLVPVLVKYAVNRILLDVPNLRSSHEVPTPRLGGVAIILGVWVGFAILRSEGTWPLLAAATLIGLVGLVDDFSNLDFKTKAAAQMAVATGAILLFQPQILSEAPGLLKPVVFGVGVFWIVALSNAFNFMDGIDGFTGGVAIVNLLFLATLIGEAGATLIVLAGATAGFLIWNVGPASIFIGDSGAYFLGFGLALFALYAPVPGPVDEAWTPLRFFSCVLVFTPYLFDTSYTLARRLYARKNVFSAHREHIYQRITSTVAMHRRTSNLYYGASVIAGFAALLAARGGAQMILGSLLALGCCTALAMSPYMIRAEQPKVDETQDKS